MTVRSFILPLSILCFSLLFSASAQAQGSGLQFGLRVGANLGVLGGDDLAIPSFGTSFVAEDVEESPRPGFLAGGFAVIHFADPLFLQLELNYVQKGQVIEFTAVPTSSSGSGLEVSRFTRLTPRTATYKLSYFEVPVLARYGFAFEGTGGTGLHVLAGPAIGFNLSSSVESDVRGEASTQDLSSRTNAREYGLILGAGLDLEVSGGRAILDARFNLGLNSIFSEGLPAHQNRGFTITAGLIF